MKQVLLINDTSNECHIGSRTVIQNIRRLCKMNDMRVVASFTRHFISDGTTPKLKKVIDSADTIIINGEGSLHHHPRRNTKWFPKILNAIPRDKKIVLINSLWQEMEKLGKASTEIFLDKMNLIAVRETYSHRDLITLYPKKEKIIVVPDILFATELHDYDIGYGDSVDREKRKTLKNTNNYLPLSYIEAGTYLDVKAINMPSLAPYISWLKSLKLYVTGRFHGMCLASMVGVPFLVLPSNSHKIESTLYDMKCPELLIRTLDEVDQKKDIAIKAIPKAHNYANQAKIKIKELFKRIGDL